MLLRALRATIVLAILAVSGTVTHAQWFNTVNKTFPAGHTGLLAFVSSLNADCSAVGIPEVRVISPPSHGQVHVRSALGYSSFSQTNQRYDCNRRRSRGSQISYTPQRGYVGDDNLSVQMFFPSGHTLKRTYHITIE